MEQQLEFEGGKNFEINDLMMTINKNNSTLVEQSHY